MSGPIIRKYGFPNFDQIFGKKDLEHGVDAGAAAVNESQAKPVGRPDTPAPKGDPGKKPGA